MTDYEFNIFKKITTMLEDRELTEREKICFIIGIAAGMDYDSSRVSKLLNRLAETCMDDINKDTIEDLANSVTKYED